MAIGWKIWDRSKLTERAKPSTSDITQLDRDIPDGPKPPKPWDRPSSAFLLAVWFGLESGGAEALVMAALYSLHLCEHPLLHFNEGNWKFESIDGCLQVSREEQANCELTIQGLSALIFGTHDPEDFSLRGWGKPAPEIQAVMRAMFPARLPFLHENF